MTLFRLQCLRRPIPLWTGSRSYPLIILAIVLFFVYHIVSMPVYTWGSATHGLGYVVSHSVREVTTPRPLGADIGTPVSFQTGRSFTVTLTEDGILYRWGVPFGLLPSRVSLDFLVKKFSACTRTGDTILVEEGSGLVHTLIGDTCRPFVHHGKLVFARDAVAVARDHWIIIEQESGDIVEIGQGRMLSPSSTLLLRDSDTLFSCDSNIFAAEHRETGHVRFWSRSMDPMKVSVKRKRTLTSSEWNSVECEFLLSRMNSFCIVGDDGFCTSNGMLIRFSLFRGSASVLFGCTVPCIQRGEEIEISSVSACNSGIYILTRGGDCFFLKAVQDEIYLDFEPFLSQAEWIVSSKHHTVASVKVFLYVMGERTTSLQQACACAIMKSMVTIENVVDLVKVLVERPVIDCPYLVDYALSFLQMNRALVTSVNTVKMRKLGKFEALKIVFDEHEKTGERFSTLLARVRHVEERIHELRDSSSSNSESEEEEELLSLSSDEGPALTTSEVKSVERTPILTPVIALLAKESNEEQMRSFDIDDFIPLADSENFPKPGMSFRTKRVKKWTKKSLGNTPPQAPWLSPTLVPSSPPLDSVMAEEESVSGRSGKAHVSRWFRAESSRSASVKELMLQEQEEREAREAIRLVEEYERALAAHHRAQERDTGKRRYNRSSLHSKRGGKY